MKASRQLKPIKRNEALVKYSREHNFGLQLCQKIKEGMKNNIEPKRISAYALFFFDKDLNRHFQDEEMFLFPKLERDDPMLKRALQEHQEIYYLINRIRSDIQNLQLLNELSNSLEEHIRFEERVLFNFLQDKLTDAELMDLAEKNSEKENDVSQEWNDKFWNYKNCSNEK